MTAIVGPWKIYILSPYGRHFVGFYEGRTAKDAIDDAKMLGEWRKLPFFTSLKWEATRHDGQED